MPGSARGRQRERDVRHHLESPEGGEWWVVKAGGSLGDADLVALKSGHRPRLIEVKSTAGGPYERFGPEARTEMIAAGRKAGAEPELAYWPPRGRLQWIKSAEWP